MQDQDYGPVANWKVLENVAINLGSRMVDLDSDNPSKNTHTAYVLLSTWPFTNNFDQFSSGLGQDVLAAGAALQ